MSVASRGSLTSASVSRVASSASNVTLAAANGSRQALILFNESTAVLYLKFGATASTSDYTLQVAASGSWTMPSPTYRGRIDGIWASANGAAQITEGI